MPEEIATAVKLPRDDTGPEDLDLKVYTTQITCHCEPRTFFRGVAVSSLIGILPAMGYVSVPEEIATAVKLPGDDMGAEEIASQRSAAAHLPGPGSRVVARQMVAHQLVGFVDDRLVDRFVIPPQFIDRLGQVK